MFFWTCLAFPNEKNVWTNIGYADLNNLTNGVKNMIGPKII